MEYISAREAADKWGVGVRVVQGYCRDGRIPDAKKFERSWMLPADAQKPRDPRGGRGVANPQFYTLPRKCPQLIMTTIYNTPGTADAVASSLGSDMEAQTLFLAQLAYFRADTDTAAQLASNLLNTTVRLDVRVGCYFTLCLCAMYAGDATAWMSARTAMARTPCDTPEAIAQRDFQLGAVDSGLYDKSGFPEWFRRGAFDPLPADSYPAARFLFLKWLMLSKNDPDVSYICGPIISQSKVEGALLSEIYCRLLTAIGFHDRGDMARAAEQIDAAVALALPDGLYGPLAEHRNELGLLLDERIEAADKAAARAVREHGKRLLSGWAALYKRIRGMAFALELTPREHHAAKLAAKGLTNAEIARRMGLSVNSVKRYISEAVSKTGARDRTELAEFIALEGRSLP